MTTITGIRTVGVPVTDQDAAIDFFTRVLGFEVRLDAPMSPTSRWIEVAAPGAATSVALIADDGSPRSSSDTGIRFTVPDAAREHEALRGHGITVGELLRWEGAPAMFTFEDPDGNGFEIVEDVR